MTAPYLLPDSMKLAGSTSSRVLTAALWVFMLLFTVLMAVCYVDRNWVSMAVDGGLTVLYAWLLASQYKNEAQARQWDAEFEAEMTRLNREWAKAQANLLAEIRDTSRGLYDEQLPKPPTIRASMLDHPNIRE